MRYKITSISIILLLVFFIIYLPAYAVDVSINESNEIVPSTVAGNIEDDNINKDVRYQFDWSTLIGLFGISLLKFIDDKLKIHYKEKFRSYRKYAITATILTSTLEITILICLLWIPHAYFFGNVNNLLLGLIPFLFYVITLITTKDERSILILSSKQLEQMINDFTESGSSPLGMIVGDMDFLGKVYNLGNASNRGKRIPKDNIEASTQLKAILENNIDNIQIVCKPPITDDDRRRIGYLQNKFQQRIHIKFFNENHFPIPNWRGRTMIKQNAQCVVITKKIKKHKEYEYSQHSVDSLPGGLFFDLWRTVWACSEYKPDILSECFNAYNNYISAQFSNKQYSPKN